MRAQQAADADLLAPPALANQSRRCRCWMEAHVLRFDGRGYTEVARGALAFVTQIRATRDFTHNMQFRGIKKGRHKAALLRKDLVLLRIHQMSAPILLPALVVVFGAERLFFSVADGLDTVCRNPRRYKSVFHGTRTIVAER